MLLSDMYALACKIKPYIYNLYVVVGTCMLSHAFNLYITI